MTAFNAQLDSYNLPQKSRRNALKFRESVYRKTNAGDDCHTYIGTAAAELRRYKHIPKNARESLYTALITDIYNNTAKIDGGNVPAIELSHLHLVAKSVYLAKMLMRSKTCWACLGS